MSKIVDDSAAALPGQMPPETAAPARSEALEVEVKFLVQDLEAVRRRLAYIGAQLVSHRTHERNVRYDTREESLLAGWQLLRLRQDKAVRLTFKGPAAEDIASEAKIREELEVTISDFAKMGLILERLGFFPVQVYEKFRETYHWRDIEIVLDETPFGDFVELEGDEKGIREAADAIGLDWSRRVLANYLALMELARRTFNLPFHDLTFENFARRSVSLADLLPVCVLVDKEDW
jgi:adenylate cyclase, class 2